MPTSRDNPGVIAPPPLLYLGALALGLALDFLGWRVRTGLRGAVRYGLALVLLALAVALAASALGRFRRAGTHAEPWRPSTALVTTGIYAFTRNPMYVSMALLYLTLALAADSVLALLLLVPLLAVIRYGVIAREERYLAAK